MSQQAVESILGRLITDEEFRCQFFIDPRSACETQFRDLPTTQEVEALMSIDSDVLTQIALALDPKIVRAIAVRRGEDLA